MKAMRGRIGTGGFTMVELSITVAILGLLAAVAVPSFITLMPRLRLGTATQTLANEMAMARMAAIAKSNEGQVLINTGDHSYALVRAGATYARTSVASFAEIEGLSYDDGTAAAVDAIHLLPNGTVDIFNAGARVNWRPDLGRKMICVTLRTKDGAHRRRVVASMMGRIFSQKWTGGGWVEG